MLRRSAIPFECWGDAALPKGLVAVQQPVIQPLFDTRGLLDVLVEWGAAVGDPAALAAVAAATAACLRRRPRRRPRPRRAPAWRGTTCAPPGPRGSRSIPRRRRSRRRGTTCCGAVVRRRLGSACAGAAKAMARPASASARRVRRVSAGQASARPLPIALRCSSCSARWRPPRPRRGSSCSSIRTSRWPTGAAATTAGSTSSPIRSRASPGAARCRSRPAASTR